MTKLQVATVAFALIGPEFIRLTPLSCLAFLLVDIYVLRRIFYMS